MADDSKQSLFSLNSGSMVLMAMLAIGSYFVISDAPYLDSRPSVESVTPARSLTEQDIDTRLWEDPFAAIYSELKRNGLARSKCPGDKSHCVSPFDRDTTEDGNIIDRVLIVSVPGSPYSEEKELRRQVRYAVLAGLSRDNFIPEDSQHIGYFRTFGDSGQTARLPDIVPFERFRSRSAKKGLLLLWFDEDMFAGQKPLLQMANLLCEVRPAVTKIAAGSISVEFVGFYSSQALLELAGDDMTSGQMDDFQKSRCGHGKPSSPWREAKSMRFFAYGASVETNSLTGEITAIHCEDCGDVHSYFAKKNDIAFFRTVASDDVLARSMTEELRKRGVLTDHDGSGTYRASRSAVALVTEWDTFYGQSLPEMFVHCLRGFSLDKKEDSEPEKTEGSELDTSRCLDHQGLPDVTGQLQEWPLQFRYLRGLDGQLPTRKAVGGDMDTHDQRTADGEGGSDAPRAEDKGEKSGKTVSMTDKLERAEGNGQFDYLRRLSQAMREIEHEHQQAGESRIKAIGVLGSDVYDKLLVMQAMRQQFPSALFFTTDLDARLLSDRELKWTRNLLVSSSYGLRLKPEVQGEIPPFRRSYQTSAFLATRLALLRSGDDADAEVVQNIEDRLTHWLREPKLFEINRLGVAEPLSSDHLGNCSDWTSCRALESQTPSSPQPDVDCLKSLLDCHDIHPRDPPPYSPIKIWSGASWAIAAGVAGVLLLAAMFLPSVRPVRVWLDRWIERAVSKQGRIGRPLIAMLLILGAFLAVGRSVAVWWFPAANALAEYGQGQPIWLMSGTSMWIPTIIRGGSIAVSIGMLIYGVRKISRNIDDIIVEFGLEPARKEIEKELGEQVGRASPWRQISGFFFYRLDEPSAPGRTGLSQEVLHFWKRYVYQGRLPARLLRMAVLTGAAFAFVYLLGLVIGGPEPVGRGAVRDIFQSISFLAFAMLVVLIAFVVDATLFCWIFVGQLLDIHSVWPGKAVRIFSDRLSANLPCVEEWIDMQFVAKRTECIGGLIYFPFFILALMIVTRGPIFADYTPDMLILLVYGAFSAVLLGCALLLRWTAEDSRQLAIKRIDEKMIAVRTAANDPTFVGQLKTLRKMVQSLDEGAFRPLSQQPLVRALLLPLGSYGGTLLLDTFF